MIVSDLRDFPDRLSPIVVKELRQGLRQKSFVVVFILLQIALAFMAFGTISGTEAVTPESITAGQKLSAFYFSLLGVAAMMIQPMRGLQALASEKSGRTLDLLLLTRLDAWSVTSGKWLALISQTALIMVSVLPYLMMRYYLGGMQLFGELLSLFCLFCVSACLTSLTVGLSATKSSIIRQIFGVILILGILFCSLAFGLERIFSSRMHSSLALDPSTPGFVWMFLIALLLLGFLTYYFLEIGATLIAPIAENRSTRKRVLGLLVMILLGFQDTLYIYVIGISFVIMVILAVDALTERPEFTASVTRPFVRFGWPGRLFGRFFYPGAVSGTLYLLLLLTVFAATTYTTSSSKDEIFGMIAIAIIALTVLLYSLFITTFLRRKPFSNAMPSLLIVLLGSVILSTFIDASDLLDLLPNTWQNGLVVYTFFPMGALFEGAESSTRSFGISPSISSREGMYVCASLALIFAIYWGLYYLRLRPFRQRMVMMEKIAMQEINPPAPQPKDEENGPA